MRKASAFVVAILMSCAAFGASQSREQKRLESCGQVFKEIMDIPDGIAKDLPNWPALYRTLERSRTVRARRCKHRLAAGWSGHGLRTVSHESQRRELNLEQQSETWRGRLRSRRAQRTHSGGGYRHRDEGRGPQLFSFTRLVRRHLTRGLDAPV